MPTFELTAILTAAGAVGTATAALTASQGAAGAAAALTAACESATSLVETEFKKVPAVPPLGCLTDVLAQDGMCALVTQARPAA